MPLVAAAVIGAAGTAYAANQANQATQDGIAAQTNATNQQIALQRDIFNQIQQNQAPYMDAGTSAIPALQNQLGLTSQQDRASYLANYQDVANEYQRLASSPEGQAYLAQQGVTSAEDFAGLHYQTNGQSEGRTMASLPTAQDQLAEQVGTRDSYTRPDQQALPTFSAPSLPNLSAENYTESPGYQYLVDKTTQGVNSGYAARGLLQSGSAVKELASEISGLQNQDYQQWLENQLSQYDRTYTGARDAYSSQYNAAMGTNALNNSNFESDRTYGTSVYDADRGYLTNQNNQQTQDLFNLAGIGQNAAANVGNAGQTYAANTGNAYQTQANALAAGYNQTAQTNASAVNNIFGIGQNLVTGLQPKSYNPILSTGSGSASGWNQGAGYGFKSPF